VNACRNALKQNLPGSCSSPALQSAGNTYRAVFPCFNLEIESKTWLNARRLVSAGHGYELSDTFIAFIQ